METQAERSERIARANIVPELESQVSAKTELVSFLELFRFANALDWVCIFVAVCASFVTGYAQVLHVHFPPRLHLLTISIFDFQSSIVSIILASDSLDGCVERVRLVVINFSVLFIVHL